MSEGAYFREKDRDRQIDKQKMRKTFCLFGRLVFDCLHLLVQIFEFDIGLYVRVNLDLEYWHILVTAHRFVSCHAFCLRTGADLC